MVGRLAAGAERRPDRLRDIRGPLGDRVQGPGAGQDRAGGQGGDGDERMSPSAGGSWVADRGEIRQQVRGFGWLERVGTDELGQGG